MTGLRERQAEFMAMLERETPPSEPRLAIYHAAVRANRHEALAACFPVVRRLVGDAFFEEAALRHAAFAPSRSGDLAGFGERFADFLRGYAPAGGLDYLPDVARLEWALHEAERAAETPAADFALLARVAPDRHGEIRLRLHPSVRLVASPHPVLAIWEANQAGGDGDIGEAAGPDHVVVARVGLEARAGRVPAADFTLLQALARGASLDEACAALGEEACRLDTLLARHAAEGRVCGFELPR